MTIRSKDRKLAELILFISQRSEGDARFSAGKLNRLLFYSDFGAYLQLGKAITGEAYQKLPGGPSPRRFVVIRDLLVARGELAIRRHEHGDQEQDRIFALRPANLTDFSPNEIALVTKLVDQSWEYDAGFKGYYSNDLAHWEEDIRDFETIPYEFALLSKRPPTENDRRYCREAGSLAAAVLSGKHKVFLYDEKALLDTGVRQPARRSRTARAPIQGNSARPDNATANKSGDRRATRRKSTTLVRPDT